MLKKAYLNIFLVCTIVFVLMIILNHFTPMYADDYDYTFSFATKERIRTISDVLISQTAHYNNQTGRFVTGTINQLLLMMNDTMIDLVLAVLFVILGLLISYHVEGSLKKINWLRLMIIYIMLFLFTPAFGQSYLWVAGASTYMCGVILILIYLIPYKIAYNGAVNSDKIFGIVYNIIMFLYMFIVGVIAGNTGENMSIGLEAIVICYLICFHLKGIKIRPWMLGIGNIIGLLLLLLSPSNQNRLDDAGGIQLSIIPKRFILVGSMFLENMWYVILFLTFIVTATILFIKNSDNTFRDIVLAFELEGYVYLFGTLGSVFSMIVLTFFPGRAWSSCVTYSIIAIMLFGNNLDKVLDDEKIHKLINILAVAVVIVCGAIYINAYFTIKNAYAENQNRINLIEEAVITGKDYVKLPAIIYYNKWCVYEPSGELSWDSDEWPNRTMARYYGLKQVIRDDNIFDY